MELENQVVSLKLAKQLKEAGYKQEGLWYWCWHHTENPPMPRLECSIDEQRNKETFFNVSCYFRVFTPTVAELGEALLDTTRTVRKENLDDCLHWKATFSTENKHYIEQADTEADCRALMWLKLKEEGLL